jgi:hypothetical protein
MIPLARMLVGILFLICFTGCAGDNNPVAPSPLLSRLDLMAQSRVGPRVVNRRPEGSEEYIVTLKRGVDHELLAEAIAGEVNGKVGYVYHNFNAFTIHSISLVDLDTLTKRNEVQSIEKSAPNRLASTQSLPTDGTIWHLDQIDQLGGPRDNLFNYFFPGNGVHIYFLDTGIDTSSGEFAGRVGNGMAYTQTPGALPYQPTNPHGTMTAGLAASSTYGVAKGAVVHAVRVIAGNGAASTSDILSGIDWIIDNIANNPGSLAVVNVSLVTPSTAIRDGYARLIDQGDGIPVVKAAGNDGIDACTDISNTVPWLLVVGATDQSDTRWSGSNYGSCVSVFAPGVGVKSVSLPGFSNTGTATSYATALVTGTVASILQDWGLESAGRMYNVLTFSALKDRVGDPRGSPNRRLSSLHTFFDYCCDSNTDIWTDYDHNATWSLHTLGGDGTWGNYLWEYSTDNVYYTIVGTDPSYSRFIPAGSSQNFYLRTSATSAGQTFTNVLYIQLHPCPPSDPDSCPL